MKQPKRLNRRQKEFLESQGYIPRKYSLVNETEELLVIQNKERGFQIEVSKKKKS